MKTIPRSRVPRRLVCIAALIAAALAGCGADISDAERLGTIYEAVGAPTTVGFASRSPSFVSYDKARAWFTYLPGEFCSPSAMIEGLDFGTGARTALGASSERCDATAESRSDGVDLYYLNWSRDEVRRAVIADGANTRVTSTQTAIAHRGIAVNNTHVYWADTLGVRRAPKRGGSAVTLTVGAHAHLLAIDSTYVYFQVGSRPFELRRVPLGGGTSTLIHTQATPFNPLVSQGANLYWASNPETGAHLVLRMAASGGAVAVLHSTTRYIPSMAINDNDLYWAETASSDRRSIGDIVRRTTPASSGTTRAVFANLPGPYALYLTSTHLYWMQGTSSNVLRRAVLR